MKTFTVTTKAGNTLQFFYNPENDLVVVDIIHKNERGGNEILRQTLDEKKLLAHAKWRLTKPILLVNSYYENKICFTYN